MKLLRFIKRGFKSIILTWVHAMFSMKIKHCKYFAISHIQKLDQIIVEALKKHTD